MEQLATENIVSMPDLLSGRDLCENGSEYSGSRQDWILGRVIPVVLSK